MVNGIQYFHCGMPPPGILTDGMESEKLKMKPPGNTQFIVVSTHRVPDQVESPTSSRLTPMAASPHEADQSPLIASSGYLCNGNMLNASNYGTRSDKPRFAVEASSLSGKSITVGTGTNGTLDRSLSDGPAPKRMRPSNGGVPMQNRSLRLNSTMASHSRKPNGGLPPSLQNHFRQAQLRDRWPAVDGPDTAVTNANYATSSPRPPVQLRTTKAAARGVLRASSAVSRNYQRASMNSSGSSRPPVTRVTDSSPSGPITSPSKSQPAVTHDHTSLLKTLHHDYPTAGKVYHTPAPEPQLSSPSAVSAPSTPRTQQSSSNHDALMIDVRIDMARQTSAPSSLPVATPPPVKQSLPSTPKKSPSPSVGNLSTNDSKPVIGADSTNPVDIRQLRMEKKSQELLQRMRNLVTSQIQYHVTGEVQQLVQNYGDPFDLQLGANVPTAKKFGGKVKNHILEQKLDSLLKNGEFKQSNFREEDLKKMSASDLAKLIKRCENKQLLELIPPSTAQSVLHKKHRVHIRTPEADAIDRFSCQLERKARDQQHWQDLDATDSSSGGESDEESEIDARRRINVKGRNRSSSDIGHHLNKRPTSVGHLSRWKWYRERAWLGSRWGWLQSQVADLEYKIRQQVDVCRQIRKSKCSLSDSEKTPSSSNCASNKPSSSDDNSDGCTCARVRPLPLPTHRKLIKTAGIYRWNRKTVRLSTVHCGCNPPFQPCTLCSGRVNNVVSSPDPCSQSYRERVALVDHSFHSVLSDRHAVNLDRKLQAYLKQQSCATRTTIKKVCAVTKKSKVSEERRKLAQKRLLLNPASTFTEERKKNLTLKLKFKMTKDKNKRIVKVKKAAAAKLTAKKKKTMAKISRSTAGSRPSTPMSDIYGQAPTSPAGKLFGARRSTAVAKYEIDNIVIDPSVLAVSRVEKLQYKEIDTPRWRIVPISLLAGEELEEDISEEGFLCRHYDLECQERKRFQAYKDSVWTAGRRLSEVPKSRQSSSSLLVDLPCTPVVTQPPQSDSRPTSPFTPRVFPLSAEEAELLENG